MFGLFRSLFSIYLSFHRWDPAEGLAAMRFVAFENYLYVLRDDEWFHKSIYNTLWLALVSGLPQHTWWRCRWRSSSTARWGAGATPSWASTLPFITSTVAISLVFSTLFSRDFGVVNAALTSMNQLPVVGWFFPAKNIDWGQPGYTKWMIAFVVWWRYVGWNAVLYLSAMQTIPLRPVRGGDHRRRQPLAVPLDRCRCCAR